MTLPDRCMIDLGDYSLGSMSSTLVCTSDRILMFVVS